MKNTLPNIGKRKIAVIELSSSAIKFLVPSPEFDISNVTTKSFLKIDTPEIDSKLYLNAEEELNLAYLDEMIIKTIQDKASLFVNQEVTEVHCYASTGFSKISKRADLIRNYIEKCTELKFTQLTGKDEARYSYISSKYILFNGVDSKGFVLNIDIGRKTTDLAFREKSGSMYFKSWNIGTDIVSSLYSQAKINNHSHVAKYIEDGLFEEYGKHFIGNSDLISENKKSFTVIMGSVISELTNKNAHKNELSVYLDKNDITRLFRSFLSKIVKKNFVDGAELKMHTHQRKIFEFYFVLLIYSKMQRIYNSSFFYVNRAGLRHGIFFDQLVCNE